ncbi:MAG: hypothetical protein HQL29_06505 [Candidatus Omnitrophica bacterium]|nr:hypothetical protein [Candidatus Omnitrophota bacterium]
MLILKKYKILNIMIILMIGFNVGSVSSVYSEETVSTKPVSNTENISQNIDSELPESNYDQLATTHSELNKRSLPTPGNITINFKEVDILTVLNYLSEVSGVDIIPTPGVKGLVTMRLRNKPWEVALDIVTRNYGYAYSGEGGIIRVMPRALLQTEDTVTEVIPLNYIVENIELKKESSSESGGEAVSVAKEGKGIKEVMRAIDSVLDKARGENATFISSANSVVITAIPAKINQIKEMLLLIDKKPAQILLEAKVVEVLLNDTEQLGINWDVIISAAGSNRPTTFPFRNDGILKFLPGHQRDYYPDGAYDTGFPQFTAATLNALAPGASSPLFSYGTLDFSQFQAVLKMISERADTNILSTPRITTLNNQKATLKVVQKVMLQKTQESLQTSQMVTVEYESDEEAREVGVKLTVIPHVNDEGDIVVNLVPEVSSDLVFESVAVSTTEYTSALKYDTREANTQVRVSDGETIFIGGLIKDNVLKNVDKIPFFGDVLGGVPFIGPLVKYDSEIITKSEVIFFVTVHLIKDGNDAIAKSDSQEQYNIYKNYNFKDGSKPIEQGNVLVKKQVSDVKVLNKPKKEKVSKTLSGEKKEKQPWFDFRD